MTAAAAEQVVVMAAVAVHGITITEVPAVVRLWDANHRETVGVELTKGEKDAASLSLVQYIQSSSGVALCLVAEGRALGYLLAEVAADAQGVKTGIMQSLYVSPEFRRRGLARLLATEARRLLVAKNACKLTVDLRPDNIIGMAFWGAVGLDREHVRYSCWPE